MHLAGSTVSGTRIATRSKTRQLEENSHLVPLNATASPTDAAQHAPTLVAVSADLHLLKPTAINISQQAGSGHHGVFLPTANKRTTVQAAAAGAAASASASRKTRLQQLPSDDLQRILDAAAAAPSSSRLVHPSLLRNAGVIKHADIQPQQQSPVRAASTTSALPALKKHASTAGGSRSHNHTSTSSCGSHSKHVTGHATRLAAASSGAVAASNRNGSRRVTFAPGPLSHANARTMISDDGHPATEGALALPVRRLPQSYPMDLTRGNVLMLETLLGSECAQSVTRLKRRVGLLPPIRPPRPHVCSRPAGRGAPFEGEEEAAGAPGTLPAATAAGGNHGRDYARLDAGHQLHLPPAAAAMQHQRLPGRARSVSGRIESCI